MSVYEFVDTDGRIYPISGRTYGEAFQQFQEMRSMKASNETCEIDEPVF